MPGRLSVPLRRRQTDQDEGDFSEESRTATPSSTRSKRRRLDNDLSVGSPTPEPSNGLTNGYRPNGSQYNGGAPKPHQPGSIVRVKLTNFVTYTSAEFHLGPSLNMIIGPNGTGKSTLVCAICLGLGWSPKHLGRAKDINEFVKHGQREAEIEIELAGDKQHKRNPVVRRIIKQDNRSSTFLLNNREVPKADITKLCSAFSIQIDNLCQFLPQDRVAEFAQLTPTALLDQTQRAAAPPEMSAWHDDLKVQYAKLGEEKKKHTGDQTQLNHLQNRQNAARQDVERLTERKQLQMRVKALEKYRPFAKYAAARTHSNEMKARSKEVEQEFAQLQTEVEPLLQSVNAKQAYRDEIKKIALQRRKNLNMFDSRATEQHKEQSDLQVQIDELNKTSASDKKSIREKMSKIAEQENKIQALREKMQHPPEHVDSAALGVQARGKYMAARALEGEAAVIKEKLSEVANKGRERKAAKSRVTTALQNLSTQQGQQENKLREKSNDSAQAWEWVQENKERFRGPVYGPPIVECSVKDPKFAKAVESAIPEQNMRAFTCTNNEDFRLLQNELLGRTGLNLSDVTISSVNQPLSSFRAPMSPDELGRFGLTGWVLDYLNGPEEVLAMLCDSAQIHRCGVTLGKITQTQHEQLVNSPIQRWLDADDKYVVNKRYGKVATAATSIPPAKIWTDTPIDTGATSELRKKIAELSDELSELQQEAEALKASLEEAGAKRKRLNEEKNALEEQKKNAQKAKNEFDLLPGNIEALENKMKSYQQGIREDKQRLIETQDQQDELALKRSQQALEYAKHVEALRLQHNSLLEAEFRLIEAESDVKSLEDENQRTKDRLETARNEMKQLKKDADVAKKAALALHGQCKVAVQDRTDEEAAIHQELGEQRIDPESLENEIEATRSKVELIHAGNPHALREYEHRQRTIEELERKLADTTDKVQGLEEQIKVIRDQWEPRLDELVSHINDAFSHNFQEIGCAGQVLVHKDEEFEKWSIQIQVRFRENEVLSVLDAMRQSGGERAVSTIFYLLSLQSLARSPFRVVDEINQGMDPRNERMVHERLVDIACDEHTSQYFLITPKLLPGLKFHPRMKVHCIASGEYMPENSQQLNFQTLAKIAMRVKGKA